MSGVQMVFSFLKVVAYLIPASSMTTMKLTMSLINGKLVRIRWIDERRFVANDQDLGGGGDGSIKAVMPGRVSKIVCKEGQHVSKGDSLLVLEAMKMENEIKADADGEVQRIHVSEGDSVEAGELLVSFKE